MAITVGKTTAVALAISTVPTLIGAVSEVPVNLAHLRCGAIVGLVLGMVYVIGIVVVQNRRSRSQPNATRRT